MSKIMIVPEEDFKVLQKYFGDGVTAGVTGSLILIPQKVLSTFSEKDRAGIANIMEYGSPELLNYNHGGEADVLVDIVLGRGHYAMEEMLGASPASYIDDDDEEND